MPGTDQRWAPWYVYAIAIVGLNLLKQMFMDGVPVAVNVAVTVVLVVGVVVGVTAAWRAAHRDRSDSSR